MAIELTYGAYQFPLAPMVTITRKPAQGFPNPQIYDVTWTIHGELYSPGSQTLAGNIALRDAMIAAFTKQHDLVWKDGSTIVKAMLKNRAIGGLRISIDLPEDDTAYATHVPYRVDVSGTFRSEAIDLLPTAPAPLPTELVCGEYTAAESIDGNEKVLSLSGLFRGPDTATLRAAVDALIIQFGGHTLNKSIQFLYDSDSAFRHQVQFQLEIVDTDASPEVYEVDETIEVRNQVPIVIPRPVLGNRPPVLQNAPLQPTIVIQQGTAAGRNGYPSEAVYAVKRVQLPLVEQPSIVRHSPEPRPGGHTAFRISWRFVMVSADPINSPIYPASAAPFTP